MWYSYLVVVGQLNTRAEISGWDLTLSRSANDRLLPIQYGLLSSVILCLCLNTTASVALSSQVTLVR